jgi:peptidoglycan/LPS O-acetylase OafA/YrhL
MYRYFGGFRFLLAIFVLLEHFIPGVSPWKTSIAFGSIGVHLFFIVSGFAIAEAMNEFYAKRPVDFLRNRFLRIYPPYLFALLAACIILFLIVAIHKEGAAYQEGIITPFVMGSLVKLFWNLIALIDPRNVSFGHHYTIFVRTIWTLVLEIEFYLFAALPFKKSHLTIFALAAYAINFVYPFPAIFKLVGFVPYFLLGALLYYRKYILSIGAALLCLVSFVSFLIDLSVWCDIYLSTLIFLGGLAAFCALCPLKSGAALARKIDSHLGNITYSLYLNHYVVGMAMGAFLPKSAALFFISTGMAIMLSYGAYEAVEPPLKRFRDIIRGRGLNED